MDYSKKPTAIIVGERKPDSPASNRLTTAQAQKYREDVQHFIAEHSRNYRFNADGTCVARN